MKRVLMLLFSVFAMMTATVVFADDPTVSGGIGSIAYNVTQNVSAVIGAMLAICYIAGLGFFIGGIVKLKAHKDTPTQVPLSTGIVWCFLGMLLLALPSFIGALNKTLFGVSGGSLVSYTGNINIGSKAGD